MAKKGQKKSKAKPAKKSPEPTVPINTVVVPLTLEDLFPGDLTLIPRKELDALLQCGTMMSNLCYNQSQLTGKPLDANTTKQMKELQLCWDQRLRTVQPFLPSLPRDGNSCRPANASPSG